MTWQILLVDDEPDIHSITRLALRKKRWRGRRFRITSAHSRAEALEILNERQDFHVAVIDVVMETDDAGLRLCEDIRRNLPHSLRLIVRTGQAGTAPEDEVLNQYDVDHYLAKVDATPSRLFGLLRACIRSSQDISTLLAYSRQLQRFTESLRSVTSFPSMRRFMREALAFLELKHDVVTAFNYDLDAPQRCFIAPPSLLDDEAALADVEARMRDAHARGLTRRVAHRSAACASGDVAVIPFVVIGDEGEEDKPMALAVKGRDRLDDKAVLDFQGDAQLFIENWSIAYSSLRLQKRLEAERVLREQMYTERMESIASMVTGVAHELNTPLGIARTSVDMIGELLDGLDEDDLDPEEREEMVDDLTDVRGLLVRNLERAQALISSFKKLSASQLSDDRYAVSLQDTLEDCLQTSGPLLKKKRIGWSVKRAARLDDTWLGFPGHLSQVILNLVQNAERYAYVLGDDGTLDVEITAQGDGFRIVFADHGRGVSPEILPRMFDPFVTSGRAQGGTGLGLAISHNIVTNLLWGDIRCESVVGEGTRFIIDVPREVPPRPRDSGAATTEPTATPDAPALHLSA